MYVKWKESKINYMNNQDYRIIPFDLSSYMQYYDLTCNWQCNPKWTLKISKTS